MKPTETLPIDGQRQQPLPPATCSASRLWRVTVEFELVVEAKSQREAEHLAEHHANQDGSEPSLTVATVLKRIEDAPEEWQDSIPFGGDRKDERTVRERVTPNAGADAPATNDL